MVGTGLGGGVGRVGRVGRGFAERWIAVLEGAVDFVGGDMVEAAVLGGFPPLQPGPASGFQQREGADQIGLDEGRWAGDGSVHMAFGGEVGDGVDGVLAQQPIHQWPVADVALNEGMPGGIGQLAQVVQRTGIGQQVKGDDAGVRLGRQQVADEIAADETSAAGHQYVTGMMFHEDSVQWSSRSNSAITGA